MARTMPKQKMEPAYVAGIVDGEGCVTISRHVSRSSRKGYRFSPQVSVTNTNRRLLLDLRDFAGAGNVRPKTMYHTNRKQGYEWQVWGQEAKRFLLVIAPYLRLKWRQAGVLIEFAERYAKARGSNKLTAREARHQERLYRATRAFNQRGVRRAA